MPILSPTATYYGGGSNNEYYERAGGSSSNVGMPQVQAMTNSFPSLTQIGSLVGQAKTILSIDTSALPTAFDLMTMTFNIPQFEMNFSNSSESAKTFRFFLSGTSNGVYNANSITFYDTQAVTENPTPIQVQNAPLMLNIANGSLPDTVYVNVQTIGADGACAASIPADTPYNYAAVAEATNSF